MARSKRYFMMYESDQVTCGSIDHMWGRGNSVKTCKQYIREARQAKAEHNPRNFRVYDSFADIDPATNFVPVVYSEA